MMEINLLPPQYRPPMISVLQRFFLLSAGLFLVGCLLCYGYFTCRLNELDTEIESLQSDEHLLQGSLARRSSIEKNLAIVKEKNNFLIKESEKNVSGYAVLVHLGLLVDDGVELREIAFSDDGRLLIKGDMSDYTHLLKFMDGFKEDVLLEAPSLINASVAKGKEERMGFTIATKVNGRGDGHNLPGQ